LIRAFEEHSNARRGLHCVTVWPRMAALVSADERELETERSLLSGRVP
jgi:hypothetical protein